MHRAFVDRSPPPPPPSLISQVRPLAPRSLAPCRGSSALVRRIGDCLPRSHGQRAHLWHTRRGVLLTRPRDLVLVLSSNAAGCGVGGGWRTCPGSLAVVADVSTHRGVSSSVCLWLVGSPTHFSRAAPGLAPIAACVRLPRQLAHPRPSQCESNPRGGFYHSGQPGACA